MHGYDIKYYMSLEDQGEDRYIKAEHIDKPSLQAAMSWASYRRNALGAKGFHMTECDGPMCDHPAEHAEQGRSNPRLKEAEA